jgi:hypothetical protein
MSNSVAPPPTNDNGKYAIIAILLLLGVGGLAYFKFRTPTVVETVVTGPSLTVGSPPPPKPRQDDDIPPPPDPIPTATIAGGKVGGPAVSGTGGGGGSGGCANSCSGSAPPELQNSLALRGRQARKCYERELASDPKLTVRMSVSVKVGAGGQACSVSVGSTDNQAVGQCVANQFRQGGFPGAKGGCVDVTVPLNFVPR